MQEQPPSDPPRREPPTGARRGRSPKPTFTPPTPESAVPPPRQAEADGGTGQPRPRRAKAAPTVLFQPPDPAQALTRSAATEAPAPRPRSATAEAVAAPSGGEEGTAAAGSDPITGDAQPIPGRGRISEAVEQVDEPGTGQESHKRTRRITAKKAAPAARKRTGSSPSGPASRPDDEEHDEDKAPVATDQPDAAGPARVSPGGAEPTGPVSSGDAPMVEPPAGPVGEAQVSDERTTAAVKKAAATPRKSGTRGAAPKKATPAKKKAPSPRKAASPTVEDDPADTTPAASRPVAPAPTAADSAEPATVGPVTPTADGDESVRGNLQEVLQPATTSPAPAMIAGTSVVSRRTAGAEWRAVGARVLDHPGFAPELLALAAVDALGPVARDWAERVRDGYPDADPDGLARLVIRRFVRMAGVGGATAAMAGLFAPVAELAAVLWTQANLVLHLAAVYGRDPGHPDRAAELLVLTLVHPDRDSAHAALDAARAAVGPGEQPWPRAAEAAWRLAAPLAAQAGGWLGLRLASRVLPGAAVLVAAAGDAAAAERLAARTIGFYRPARLR